MRRRGFLTLIGGGAVAYWPLTSRAAGGRPRIGVLSISSAEREASNMAAFRDALQQFGYSEGRS